MLYQDTVKNLRQRKEFVEQHHYVATRKANSLIKEYNRLIYNLGCISTRHEGGRNSIAENFGKDQFDAMKVYQLSNAKVENLKVSEETSLESYQEELSLYRDTICKDLNRFLEDLTKVNKKFDSFKEEVNQRLSKGNLGLELL